MGFETIFTVIAVDNTGKKKHSQEEIRKLCLEEMKHGNYSASMNEEEFNKEIDQRGLIPFIEVRSEKTEDSEKYHYLPEQKNDPFPLWIDTKSGNEGYEIFNANFLSDFQCLYDFYRNQFVNECIEIPVEDVKKMLQVLNYILAGKYDRDLEDALFESNEFFQVFEDQFYYFKDRYRKQNRKSKQQTIKVIIKDERTDVEKEIEDSDDDYEYDAETREAEKSERGQVQYLKSVLSAFLMMKEPDWKKPEECPVLFKLAYFVSY